MLVLCIILSLPRLNSRDWIRPEQEGGRWGIKSTGTKLDKKGFTIKEDKWLFKPQWDMVWIDSSRFGCGTGGSGCDGFITLKKGKYGYAWANGNLLPNEFDEIDLVNGRKAKKDGRWGGFEEHVQVLPFEYEDLVYCGNYQKQYSTGDGTTCLLYGTRQQAGWGIIAAIVGNNKLIEKEIVFPSSFEGFLYHPLGATVRKQGQWYFVNLQNRGEPQYSSPYDSIINLGVAHAVLKNKHWMPVLPGNNSPLTNSLWDSMGFVSSSPYLIGWKGRRATLLKVMDQKISPVFEAEATAIKIVKKSINRRDEQWFEVTNDTNKSTYSTEGRLISATADSSVWQSVVKGPFRINRHYMDQYNVMSVMDSASGEVLIPPLSMSIAYEDHPILDHVLFIKTKYQQRHGLYHFASRTYIHPLYANPFEIIGNTHLVNTTGEGPGLDKPITLWQISDMLMINLPFTATKYKPGPPALIASISGDWYELGASLVPVRSSSLERTNSTLLAGLKITTMEDGTEFLKSMNELEVNKRIEKRKWLNPDENILELTIEGKSTIYFASKEKAVACRFNPPQKGRLIGVYWPYEKWPGDANSVPVALYDSSEMLVMVHVLNNKRFTVPLTYRGEKYVYKTTPYEICGLIPGPGLMLCNYTLNKCPHCKDGFTMVEVTRTIKGETTYTSQKTTTQKKVSERVWDSRINGHRTVEKTVSVSGYEMVPTKNPDRIEKVIEKQRCKQCNGKGLLKQTDLLIWDGREFGKRG